MTLDSSQLGKDVCPHWFERGWEKDLSFIATVSNARNENDEIAEIGRDTIFVGWDNNDEQVRG